MNNTLVVINPMNNEIVGKLNYSSAKHLKTIVSKAVKAQKTWAALSIHQRGEILYKFADLVQADREKIGHLSMLESGKPLDQATGEVDDGVNIVRACVERARHLYGEVFTDNDPGFENDLWFTRREPIGVIGAIIPFNFPIELVFQKLAPALTMGNAIVVKCPTSNPLAIFRLAKHVEKSGFPKDLINFYVADHDSVKNAILENYDVKAIAMTGSSQVGCTLMANGASSLKRMFLELGGNDPFIIFDDVDVDKAVEECLAGRVEANGQVCCAAKRFIVHESIKDELVQKLIEGVKKWKIGQPTEPGVVITSLISEKEAKLVEEQVNKTISEGATLVYGGKREGARYYPTILDNITKDMEVAKNMEIFGPVFPIISFATEEEALRIANNTVYGLSSGVMTSDMKRAFRVASKIQSGTCVLNGNGLYRRFEQPFGGPNLTGLGREGVSTTLEEYSQVKSYCYKKVFEDDV